jgi:SAM-dependent methyltransferase
MSPDDDRPSSRPPFWDERYAANEHLFGREPNAFVAAEAHRIPAGSEVLELGAGEGRTLLWLARERGVHGTAVDFSGEALAAARRRADRAEVSLDTVEADVRTWAPERQWDAVLVTFLQLLPDERRRLYDTMRECVRPGGLLLGEWFRPAHLSGDYDRLGPPRADRMVPVDELRRAFSADTLQVCTAADVTLEEGPILRGRAAVARLVARRADGGAST